MAFLIDFFVLLLYVELAEEIESDYGVDVHDNRQQHHREHQLFAVVSYGLQNGTQCLEANSDIEQVSGKEEVIEVAHH